MVNCCNQELCFLGLAKSIYYIHTCILYVYQNFNPLEFWVLAKIS